MDAQTRKMSRLKRSGEFRLVREAGVSFAGKWLVFGVWKVVPRSSKAGKVASVEGLETSSDMVGTLGCPAVDFVSMDPPRFGVVTSRKVGGAVVRNRVRRRIRHIQQSHLSRIRTGVWCVTVARFRAAEATFSELEAEWCKLAKRAGVLNA
jgi:ribonuclease P protein component